MILTNFLNNISFNFSNATIYFGFLLATGTCAFRFCNIWFKHATPISFLSTKNDWGIKAGKKAANYRHIPLPSTFPMVINIYINVVHGRKCIEFTLVVFVLVLHASPKSSFFHVHLFRWLFYPQCIC